MPRKTLTADGDPMPEAPKSPAGDDVAAAIHLLEWARAKGFVVGPRLTVGSVTLQVADMRQADREGGQPRVERDVYATHGAGEEPAEGTD